MKRAKLVRGLLRSKDPSIRWRTRVGVLGESRSSPRIARLEREIRRSPRVRGLLSHQNAPYREGTSRSIYHYWQGIHWALASLVDLGYPTGAPELRPLLDRSIALWLSPHYFRTHSGTTRKGAKRRAGVVVIQGRARRCASQQGNALYYATKLGLLDDRSKELAKLLVGWQWPDGGWNCDRTPEADTSSFMETLLPMRALAAYATSEGDAAARKASERASEVFLERQLFRRRSNGAVISPEFVKLHYPLYWHYDVLGGLKGMVDVGRISDPRCSAALDLLEGKELPAGGWPAEASYFRVSTSFLWGCEYVDWGRAILRKSNDWVTTDALFVLKEAGRL